MSKYVGIQTQQEKNNRTSIILLIAFPCVLLALSWSFFFFLMYSGIDGHEQSNIVSLTNTLFLQALPFVLGGCLIWFLIAYFFNVRMIQSSTGAKPLSRQENKRVYNLVENLCIETNMAIPKINIIEDDSLNAFASGINNKTFTVTLTRGIINKLDDDELEGVIAHELTHIRNRDVRVLIISIVFVGIFAFLVQMLSRSILYSGMSSRKSSKSSNGNIIVIIVLLVLSVIAYCITLLMRFAISRKREYMADAGSAEMTHKPWALASALRKISDDPRIETVQQKDVAQLFIENPLQEKAHGLFATHPSIKKRIKILEQF